MVATIAGQSEKIALRRLWAFSLAVLLCLSGVLGLIVAALARIALFTLAFARPEVDARAAVADTLAGVIGGIPLVGNALSALSGNLGLAQWLEPNLGLASLVIGFLIGLVTLWSRSRKVSTHLFLPIDRSIALPFSPPTKALEPLRPMPLADPGGRPMLWVEPREGRRKDVWMGLMDFAMGKGGKFEYQLLLGGPGSGKTRMSIEFARRILAKKGEADDTALVLHGPDNHDRLITRTERLRSWWRIRVLGCDPLRDDIWHVGWISPEALYTRSGRLKIKGQLGKAIDLWRPTRPTFLLLDDPLHEDSACVVEILNNNAASFRHRVRLLIANQTVPGDLYFSRAHSGKAWQSQVHPPFADPLMLSADAPLSDSEIRLLAGQLPPKIAQPILSDGGVRDFRAATRGNPFLVELGLAWLSSGKPMLQMTEESLLEDRTQRFLQAIETAGFVAGQGQLVDLLTMATIANGAPTTLPAGSDGETVWTIFDVQRIDQHSAARLFPAEVCIDLKSYLPPLRPETIAIAFARMALARLVSTDRNRIIRTAWQANPLGTLRTLLRIDGGYKFRTDQEDPLQAAFAAVPMQIGLAPIEVFRLLAQASCSASLQDWEDGRYHLGTSLLESAIAAGQDLQGDDLPLAFTTVVDLILADRSTRILRETNAARLLMTLLRALYRVGRLFDAQVLGDLARWASTPRALGHQCLDSWEFGGVSQIPCPPGTTARLLDMAITAYDIKARILLNNLTRAAAAQEPALPDADMLRDCAAFMVAVETLTLTKDSSGFRDLQSQLPGLVTRAQRRTDLALAVMASFAGALALGGANSRAAFALLDKNAVGLVAANAQQAVPNLMLAKSRRYAMSSDVAQCRQMAERVETIALCFPDHEKIQRELAEAWRFVADATRSDVAQCRQMAERVEAIALRFPDHEGIQRELVFAWCFVTFATRSDVSQCRQMAERVEATALRFPDHEGIQHIRANVWRFATYATRLDAPQCRQMAERVDLIAQRFPDHQGIQCELAHAWNFVTFASRSDLAQCRQMAGRVETIALRFPDDQEIQSTRAKAWRVVTYASRLEAAQCRQMAERVETIALRFLDHKGIQRERAKAWGTVAYAMRSDVAQCYQMAERVETIALRFPDHEGIQRELAEAWRFVTEATRSDVARCRQMAERVEAIALRFPHNESIQCELARAWIAITYATRSDLAQCRQVAERVRAIARRFPQSSDIKEEARKAASHLSQYSK